jgi:excisionase family DNA binding protein
MTDAVRWLTTREAADRACCGPTAIRYAVRAGRLRAARIRRGELRFLESWIEEWLIDQVMPESREIDVAVDVALSGPRELSCR